MHIVALVAFLIGGVVILGAALVGVLQDLLQRGPYEAPVLEDDRLRHHSAPSLDSGGRSPAVHRRTGSSASEHSVAASDLQLP